MKTNKLYYEETYGDYYTVEAETPAEAIDKLREMINVGMVNGPEECQGSRVVTLYGGEDGFKYQLMDDYIDNLSENEKLFFLWKLCKWYPQILNEDKEGEDHPAIIRQIERLKSACEEMEELICYKLF